MPLKINPYLRKILTLFKMVIFDHHRCSKVNIHLASLSLKSHDKTLSFISVYLPFDNNSFVNFSGFQSSLQIILELSLFYTSINH